jgi:hypothetical protein
MFSSSTMSVGGISVFNLHITNYLEGNLIFILPSTYIPRKGEKICFDENFYIVSDVIHNVTCGLKDNPKITKIKVEVEEY